MQPGRRLTDLEPAGFAIRLAAFLIDIVIVCAAVVLLLQFVLDPLRAALGPGWARVGWFYIGYALLTVSLPIWLYFTGYEAGDQHATLGKRWLGLTVAGASGTPPSFGRAFLRTIVKLMPFEIAHIVIAVPANPFIDPLTAGLILPGMKELGGTVLAGLLVALLLLGATMLSAALHPDRRALHDLLAGTWVVKTAPRPATAVAPATASPGIGGSTPTRV